MIFKTLRRRLLAMTHKIRKRFLIGAAVTAQLILVLHIAVLVYLYMFTEAGNILAKIGYIMSKENGIFLSLSLTLQAAVAGGALLGLFLFFRKTPSPEVFFFQFALLGFSISSLRIIAVPLSLQVMHIFSFMPITRLVFFGRLFTVLCLFLSGLFSTGLTFQKQGSYLLTVFTIAAIIATNLPVDCTSFQNPLLCETGEVVGFRIAYYLIAVFAVVNYLYASLQNTNRDYSYNAGAILLVLIGISLSFAFAHTPVGLLGPLLILAGAFVFAQTTHRIYQWF